MTTFKAFHESKTFFPKIKTDDGEKSIRISLVNAMLVITTKWGDTVSFRKSSRGTQFHDSRQKKPISEAELRDELARLLDSKEDVERAFNQINV